MPVYNLPDEKPLSNNLRQISERQSEIIEHYSFNKKNSTKSETQN